MLADFCLNCMQFLADLNKIYLPNSFPTKISGRWFQINLRGLARVSRTFLSKHNYMHDVRHHMTN